MSNGASRRTGGDVRRGGGGGKAMWAAAALVLALFLLAPACAAPHREKRVVDQIFTELEHKSMFATTPAPVISDAVLKYTIKLLEKMGRRRRSEEDALSPMGVAGGEDDVVDVGDVEGDRGRLTDLLASLEMQRLHRPSTRLPRPLTFQQ